jgi:hypothetical protein
MDSRFYKMTMSEELDELERMANEGYFNPFCTVKDMQEQMAAEFGILNFPADICVAILNLAREKAGMPLILEEAKPATSEYVCSPYIPKQHKTSDIDLEH